METPLQKNVEELLQRFTNQSVTALQRAEVAKTIAMMLACDDQLRTTSGGVLGLCKAFWRRQPRFDFAIDIEEIEEERDRLIGRNDRKLNREIEASLRVMLEKHARIIDAATFDKEMQTKKSTQENPRIEQALSRHSIALEQFLSFILRHTLYNRTGALDAMQTFVETEHLSVEQACLDEKAFWRKYFKMRQLGSNLLQAIDICQSRAHKMQENAPECIQRLKQPIRTFLQSLKKEPQVQK